MLRFFIGALGGFAAAVLWGASHKKKAKVDAKTPPQQPANPFVRYRFGCRLCSGETFFDALPHMHEARIYELECKWCGIQNRVEVRPTCNQQPKA